MKRILKVLGISLIFMTLITSSATADDEFPITYSVTASALNVRFAPGAQFNSFFQLTRGEEVSGKESQNGWTEINCYGFRGFAYSACLKEKSAPGESMTLLGNYYITGYDPYCAHCCGKSDGITASGVKAVIGETIAMSGLPFGTRVYIDGLGYYTVHDKGVGAGVADVACSGHAACCAITGRYNVYFVN